MKLKKIMPTLILTPKGRENVVLKPPPQRHFRLCLRSRIHRTTSFHYPTVVDHLVANVNRITLRVGMLVSSIGSVAFTPAACSRSSTWHRLSSKLLTEEPHTPTPSLFHFSSLSPRRLASDPGLRGFVRGSLMGTSKLKASSRIVVRLAVRGVLCSYLGPLGRG
ncbi:hypothetical protein JHK84_052309 [Glycine max]|nr:hypothetical protein JHK86_052270 [Glycine max]KAG5082271.1 hypothetical protein JHK84_052309 [Glycine max]